MAEHSPFGIETGKEDDGMHVPLGVMKGHEAGGTIGGEDLLGCVVLDGVDSGGGDAHRGRKLI